MKELIEGHIYELEKVGDGLSAKGLPEGLSATQGNVVRFRANEPDREWDGVTSQELLRAVIAHTEYCNRCLPSEHNARIIWHCRMAIAHHEARTIVRKVETGKLAPEKVLLNKDGHIVLYGSAGVAWLEPAGTYPAFSQEEPTYQGKKVKEKG